MPVELPPDYHPSLSEDYMNPAQIEYFRRKLWEFSADLRRELEALPQIEPDESVHEGDRSDKASADADRSFDAINRARIQNSAASNRASACQARKRYLWVLRGYR